MEEDTKEKESKRPILTAVIVLILCIIGLVVWASIASNKDKEQQIAQQDSGYLFTSELEPRETATIILQCDEERYQKSFNDFVANGLKEEKADVIGVTGGPRWFVAPKDIELPNWMKPMKRAGVELLKRHSPGKIILIAHSHCIISDVVAAWKDETWTSGERRKNEIEQLKESGRLIGGWFPASRIEMYYAEEAGSKLGFIEIQQDEESEKAE